VDAASHDSIALGSLHGQIDVHSIEEQSGEVQKVCLPSAMLSKSPPILKGPRKLALGN